MTHRVICGDVTALPLDGEKFHAVIADPPYSLKFMNKRWDDNVAMRPETWEHIASHMHDGAFGMAFSSSRTWHRLACAIEDAGLRIFPSIFVWLTGQSFPKSTRIDTQIDRAAGKLDERAVVGEYQYPDGKPRDTASHTTKRSGIYSDIKGDDAPNDRSIVEPATPLARAWAGHRYGLQVLKNSAEPIIVFQKPYVGKPVDCITRSGAGALNIDGARVGTGEISGHRYPGYDNHSALKGKDTTKGEPVYHTKTGRWPPNFCMVHDSRCVCTGTKRVKSSDARKADGTKSGSMGPVWGDRKAGSRFKPECSTAPPTYNDPDGLETVENWRCVEECPVRLLDEQAGERPGNTNKNLYALEMNNRVYGKFAKRTMGGMGRNDKGGPSRFYYRASWELEQAEAVRYVPKCNHAEADTGLLGLFPCLNMDKPNCIHDIDVFVSERHYMLDDEGNPKRGKDGKVKYHRCHRNGHPTKKPLALTRWLATLLLPPEEYAPRRILVPFSGSGSEAAGAVLAGWDEVIAVDNEEEYNKIALARLEHWAKQPEQRRLGI